MRKVAVSRPSRRFIMTKPQRAAVYHGHVPQPCRLLPRHRIKFSSQVAPALVPPLWEVLKLSPYGLHRLASPCLYSCSLVALRWGPLGCSVILFSICCVVAAPQWDLTPTPGALVLWRCDRSAFSLRSPKYTGHLSLALSSTVRRPGPCLFLEFLLYQTSSSAKWRA